MFGIIALGVIVVVILTLVFVPKSSLAAGMRWAARFLSLGATAWFSLYAFFAWVFSEGQGSEEVSRFSTWIAVAALAGFLSSWWRAWLGGAFLIVACLTSLGMAIYLGLVIYTSPISHNWFLNTVLLSILGFGSWLLVSGILFLLCGRIAKKPGSTASLPHENA